MKKNSPTSFFRIALPWLHSEFLILGLEIELSELRAQQEAFFEHANALRLHQNLNKPTNKLLEAVRKRSEVTMKDD